MPSASDAITFAVFVMAAATSLAGSVILVSRLGRLGVRLGCTEAILGLLTAFAADAPELTSAITALLQNQNSIGIGVVLGSNVFNLAALLGFGALVAGRIALHRRVVIFAGSVSIWVAFVCAGVIMRVVTPGVGLGLALLVMVPYVAVSASWPEWLPLPGRMRRWLRQAVSEEEIELAEPHDIPPATGGDLALGIAALVVVTMASAVMEHSASSLGRHAGIPAIVTGAVILAAVTSLPNAVGAVYLARQSRGSAVLSEALNSNTLNVVFGLLIPSVILGLGARSAETSLVVSWYVVMTLCVLLMTYLRRGLDRRLGPVIIAGYGAFIMALLTF